MFRFRQFAIFFFVLLVSSLAGAVTTARDIRAALQELAEFDGAEAAQIRFPKEFAERTRQLRYRLRDFAIGSVIDGARRATKEEEVLTLAKQRLGDVTFPLHISRNLQNGEAIPRADLQLFAVPGAPAWIGAITKVALPCGSDYGVYFLRVVRRDDGSFEASLAFAKENGVDSVQDLSQDLQVAAVLGASAETLRIATIESAGGCVSYWHPVSMRVFETTDTAYRPARLFERQRLAFLGDSLQPRVSVLPEGFAFEYRTLFWLDADRPSRREEVRLVNEGPGVRSLPPTAEGPLEFVDEWLTLPWQDARKWTTREESSNVRKWHHNLADMRESRRQTSVVSSGECRDGQEVWVQLRAGSNGERTQSVYGLLRVGPSGFRVDQFSTELPRGCRAENSGQEPREN